MVRNVVRPAKSSVRTSVPAAFSPKSFSSKSQSPAADPSRPSPPGPHRRRTALAPARPGGRFRAPQGPQSTECEALQITAYDHVGIRVTDRARALAFYADLGFVRDAAHSTPTADEIVNPAGIRLNLIPNGVPTPEGDNVLLDRPQKWPGYTHAAFIVERLSDILDWAAERGVPITEGPVDW